MSVPPDTRRTPPSDSVSASAAAFFTTWCWYSANSGCMASFRQTALPAMTCISGPPWLPGKMAESIFFASSALQRMTAPRGPRRVLCVVVVTTSAYGTGEGCAPPATRPPMCAMSTNI